MRPTPRRRPPRPSAALSGRGERLIGQAAERSRVTLRSRRERLATAARPIVHTAVAAAVAWLVATEALGHERPFFAPIAACVALGVTVGRRGRRAVEMVIGVAVGIGVADLLVFAIGTGTAQVALVVALAMTAALLVGGGPLLASQAATSAVLVATLQPPADVFSFDRFLDALVGGGVALGVSAVLLPVDPVALVRRAAEPVFEELIGTLADVAGALAAGDLNRAEEALLRGRAVDEPLAALREALVVAGEAARLTPGRRRARVSLARYAAAARQVDLAVRNVRVMARGAVRALSFDDNVPAGVPEALGRLADAARGLSASLENPSQQAAAEAAAVQAAAAATAVLEQTANLSVSVIVGQVRSTAVDLLRALGVGREEAMSRVRAAAESERAAP